MNKENGADCYDFNLQQEVQILDNADAILAVGEFPKAGAFEWTSENTGTCTWSALLGEVAESPVYTVDTGAGSETMNADELADGVVTLGTSSGVLWLSICPSTDVDCKKYEK